MKIVAWLIEGRSADGIWTHAYTDERTAKNFADANGVAGYALVKFSDHEAEIKAAVVAEREACAKVCEMCDDVETAIRFIRARGKT